MLANINSSPLSDMKHDMSLPSQPSKIKFSKIFKIIKITAITINHLGNETELFERDSPQT